MMSGINISHRYEYVSDEFIGRRIKSFIFDKPVPLDKALAEIRSDENIISHLSLYKYFLNKILNQIQVDLLKSDILKKIRVKGMINYGQTAFVFETEEGDVLKITSRNHFLNRKPEKFDIPIKWSHKPSNKSFCYYYLEEFATDDISLEEAQALANNIKKDGFNIEDLRMDQIGKMKDGKVILLDPECVRKRGLFSLIKHKFAKIKSYLHIITR